MVEKKSSTVKNMRDDDELEMLLGEIPHVTASLNFHPTLNKQNHQHASLYTNHYGYNSHVHGMYDQFEELQPHLYPGNGFWLNPSEGNLVDDLDLNRSFSNMYISTEQGAFSQSLNLEKHGGVSDSYRMGFSEFYGGSNLSIPRGTMNVNGDLQNRPRMSDLIGSQFGNSALSPQFPLGSDLASSLRPSVGDIYNASQLGMNIFEARDALSQFARVRPNSNNEENLLQCQIPTGRNKLTYNSLTRGDSLILPGGGVSVTRSPKGTRTSKPQPKFVNSPKTYSSFLLPLKFNSLYEAKGQIYHIAKDQNGCRFLQRMFDEGTSRDVEIIFNEIIEHVVELMMNPFGNYLMQKLLEVCDEEQRMRLLLRVTQKPGELVRISLNTHGTRVVQKLIETLKTRQQIAVVISALEPGFLLLIKDLNGNHVIQRCLVCFRAEDSKFIFLAATKYCVDIAKHQHGCCVLQRCISHSSGEHREKLVSEISANGLFLAQDSYGNYVVQFILENIPSAIPELVSQFEGNFVQLSTQKFSSHVVEKFLSIGNNEIRSKIIRELLCASYFDQLLQDPHANYVIQTALRVAEGPLFNALVCAIDSYKATSRNSPYSKRIFSHKLLKR